MNGQNEGAQRYNIVRFYRDPAKGSRTIRRNVTLDEAQEHCNDPATRDPAGKWFDGYVKR